MIWLGSAPIVAWPVAMKRRAMRGGVCFVNKSPLLYALTVKRFKTLLLVESLQTWLPRVEVRWGDCVCNAEVLTFEYGTKRLALNVAA
ncbi:MAG: hypothetical protein IJK42_15225 [Prevotella sp.]|nr:hypothetical protein [Prevotella sp.]